MQTVLEAIHGRRSIRRFTDRPIEKQAIEAMLEAARLSPTGRNRQPLAFGVALSRPLCEKIFPHTAWAGSIPDGSAGPTEKTQPTAYIALLVDKTVADSADTDAGAAAMSILLMAQAQGIATCWLGSVDREKVLALMGIDGARYAMHTLIALGYPAMRSRAVASGPDGSLAYYLEDPDGLCVPKRAATDVFLWSGENLP